MWTLLPSPTLSPSPRKMETKKISHVTILMSTAYGLDGPGIESRWGEIFRTSPDRP